VDEFSEGLKKFSMGRDLKSGISGISALSVFDTELFLEGEKLILHDLVNGLLTNQSS
jgi:hypothetical protein